LTGTWSRVEPRSDSALTKNGLSIKLGHAGLAQLFSLI